MRIKQTFMYGFLAVALAFTACDDGSGGGDDDGSGGGGGTTTGLYMGINGFNENVTNRPISLLNTGTKNQFQGFIDSLSMKPATGLYYAVDNAIDKLQAATLPSDLVNVSVVTFTDGLDNASTAIKPNYTSRDEYRDAVSARLRSTKIKNLNISAYSIGIKGGDVTDTAAFSAGLAALASNASNAKEVTSMAEVESTFVQIANSLYSESQSQSIRLRLAGGYDDGSKIRFTFDDVSDVTNSNLYIEGTFRRSGTARSLQNVVYQGLTSSSGTAVSGAVSGVYVYFTFTNTLTTSGDSVDLANVQQWEYIQNQTRWQRNSEFGGADDIETIVDRKSAVIMLVLDCTTSLNADGADGFSEMQTAAKNFIDVLVSGDSGGGGGGGGGSGTGTENNPIPLTNGVWANGSITSTVSGSAVWYSFSVTSGTTYYLWWNDLYYGNGTKTLDVRVSVFYNNGTNLIYGLDSGWDAWYFTPNQTGTLKIKVEPYFSGNTGTFAVAYRTISTRP